MNNKEQHIWYFPSKGLKALFDEEIRGQISDGAWENSTPHNHWHFWCHLKSELSDKWDFRFNTNCEYESKYPKKKSAYNLVGALLDPEVVDLSDRMRAYYVDAELGLGLGQDAEELINEGGVDRLRKLAASSDNVYWAKKVARIDAISPEKLEAFHKAYEAYTRKDLIKDLRLIKKQMKVVIELAK